jgi:hypothetical protein
MNNKIFYVLILGIFTILSCTETKKENSDDLQDDNQSASIKTYKEPGFKKYDIRSGNITYSVEKAGVNTIKKVYFDDYGSKEVSEIYNNGYLIEKLINKGDGNLYTLDFKNNKGIKRKTSMHGTEQRFDIEEMPEDMKKENKVLQGADEKIIEKICKSYSMESGGIKTTKSGYGHIILRISTEMGGTNKMRAIATEMNENIEIAENIFDIPENFSVKEF